MMKRALLGLALGIMLLTQIVAAQSSTNNPANRDSAPPAQAGPEGHWEGEIAIPGTALGIHVDLSRAHAAWQATIDIPQQGAQGLALQAVRVEAPQVHFELQAGPGLAVFDGKLEGDKIAGTFSQAGQTFPFSLERKSAAAASAAAAPAAKPSLDGLDEFVTQAMKDWKVPGLALAVVQGDKVILQKGYGYRDLEKQLPVTPNTLFAIGSITKSFTVTTLGMEMDEGKVDWDKPVRDYLPTFKLFDPALTEQMTMRDLITHRSGLPRHDLIWYSSDFTREDLLRRLQYLEPSKPLRAKFQYNNLMFMTAGYIAGQLNGTSWEDAIIQRVFRPLEMTGTNFSVLDSQNSPDFAEPYRKGSDLKAELKRIPFDAQCPNRCAIGPAGEINSNVADMSKYLLFHMNRGKIAGKQLLSENNAVQMQVPQMVIQGAPAYKELGETNYGMGFFLSSYRGHKQVEHGGNIDGFSAELAFLPADKIGVVALTNLDGNPLPTIVAQNVFDRLLGMDQVPWNQRMLAAEAGGKKSEQEAKDKGYTPRKSGTHPSHDLKEYAGDYSNPGYGIVTVAPDGVALKLTLNQVARSLEHYHYDVFQVPANPLDPFEKMKVMFLTDINGDISSISVPLEPSVKDIVFTRMPDKQLTQRSFIEAFTGDYEIPGSPVPLKVSLRGENKLIVTVPGQPDYQLNPNRGTTFQFAELSGFTIEFKRDASGKVTEAALNELGTVIVLKKKF
jgi:CubicO group peptidase (beta-lactamase class C family)